MDTIKQISSFRAFILAPCCSAMSISTQYMHDGLKAISHSMGQFYFTKFGPYGRPVYQNSRQQYLFYSEYGSWSVSYTKINKSHILSINYFFRITGDNLIC